MSDRWRLSQDLVRHVLECGGAERLGVKIRIVELSVDLASFDLTKSYLFLDVIEHHKKVLAFLGVSRVVVGHSDDGTIVLHNDGW